MSAPRKPASKGKAAKPAARGRMTARDKLFVREYLVDLDAKRAALAAGFSQTMAESKAYMWVSSSKLKPAIYAAVMAAMEERAKRLELTADDVLSRLWTVVTTPATALTNHHVGSCRYCWGEDHQYQWKTDREYQEAMLGHDQNGDEDSLAQVPTNEGGFGYRLNRPPHSDCPECGGLGQRYTRFADTANLSPEALMLFEGVKETKGGLEFIMADKGKALDMIARHLGMFKERVEHDVTDPLKDLLMSVQGSALPVATSGEKP